MTYELTPEELARYNALQDALRAQYNSTNQEWESRARQNNSVRNGGHNSFDEQMSDWQRRREAFWRNDDSMTDAQAEHFANANSGRRADEFVMASSSAAPDSRYADYENVDMATFLKLRASGDLK